MGAILHKKLLLSMTLKEDIPYQRDAAVFVAAFPGGYFTYQCTSIRSLNFYANISTLLIGFKQRGGFFLIILNPIV